MKNLDQGYSAEYNTISKEEWSEIIQYFDDATIFQTWEYGEISWGKEKLGHVVLKRNNEVVAAAQLRIQFSPKLYAGFAHVSWGPLWKRQSHEANFRSLANVLRALYNEYVINKKLLLRIRINCLDSENSRVKEILREESFIFNKSQHQYRTILLDLEPDLKILRSNLHKTWGRYLRRAEEKNIDVSINTNQRSINQFSDIYIQMTERKRMTKYIIDNNLYKNIQVQLPENLKLKIVLASYKNEILGGLMIAAIGNTAMYINGATSTKSIDEKLYTSYFLHWHIISWLKNNGFKYYDLRGYEPDKYPGVSQFKAGLSGQDVRFMGSYEAYENRISLFAVRFGEWSDLLFQRVKSILYFLRYRFHI